MATRTVTTLPIVDEVERVIEERGLSRRAAAAELGVSGPTISYWLRGTVVPQLNGDNQAAFARFLGVPPRRVVELFGLDLGSRQMRGYHMTPVGEAC